MYKIDDIGSLYRSLPPNLRSVENECMSYAIDRQIAKLYKFAEKMNLWGNLDRVDPKYYGSIATCLQTPYYNSEYSDDMKLRLIKETLEAKKTAGTKQAIRKMVETIYDNGAVIPWYEYDGQPYHFIIQIEDKAEEDSFNIPVKSIESIKAKRSVLDAVVVNRTQNQELIIGGNFTSYSVPPAIIDGYRAEESVSGEYTAAVGALINMSQKVPAIT